MCANNTSNTIIERAPLRSLFRSKFTNLLHTHLAPGKRCNFPSTPSKLSALSKNGHQLIHSLRPRGRYSRKNCFGVWGQFPKPLSCQLSGNKTLETKLATTGAHHQEPATTAYSCHGVFTDRSTFSLNLSRIQIPTGTSLTNCNHKHGLMLTCRHDIDVFT